MGALGPYARPNGRRAELGSALPLSLARGAGGFNAASLLFFGAPSLAVSASALARGAFSGSVTPAGARAAASAIGAGAGPVRPTMVVSGVAAAVGSSRSAILIATTPALVRGAGGASLQAGGIVLRNTLLGRLGPAVGRLRAALTRPIGDRPYRLYLVTARHGNGEPGRGSVARTRVEIGCGIDPRTGMTMPPKIDVKTRQAYDPGRQGLVPSSGPSAVLHVTQISQLLVERDIVNFADLDVDQESYFEFENVGALGGVGGERPVVRYRLAEKPFLDAYGMGWSMKLIPVEPSKAFGGPRL